MYSLLDIGATNTRIALVKSNKILKIIKFPTQRDFKKELNLIAQNHSQILKNLRAANLRLVEINKVVCGFAGGVKKGLIKTSPNIKTWIGRNLKSSLGRILKTKVKVIIKNDAYLGALGEKYFGRAKRLNQFYFLTIGSGIGGALFQNGQVNYAEPGHQIIFNKRKWQCRQQGCLEAFASGRAVEKFYKIHPRNLKNKNAWLKVNDNLARGILNISQITGIKTIILGGSMLKSGLELRLLKKFIEKQAGVFEAPKLLSSKLKDKATLYGCLYWANGSKNL